MIKRCMDVLAAGFGLLLLLPLFLIVALVVKLDSRGPVFFTQQRVGKRFRIFQIFKFRTMIDGSSAEGRMITAGRDPRITRAGAVLRSLKIDELPQLYNVLKGDMSLVGPRPEVPRYVEMFREAYSELLEIRPGITDLSSIKYRNEAALLGSSGNPEEYYVTKILPDKIALAKEYLKKSSLLLDLELIVATLIGARSSDAPESAEDPGKERG